MSTWMSIPLHGHFQASSQVFLLISASMKPSTLAILHYVQHSCRWPTIHLKRLPLATSTIESCSYVITDRAIMTRSCEKSFLRLADHLSSFCCDLHYSLTLSQVNPGFWRYLEGNYIPHKIFLIISFSLASFSLLSYLFCLLFAVHVPTLPLQACFVGWGLYVHVCMHACMYVCLFKCFSPLPHPLLIIPSLIQNIYFHSFIIIFFLSIHFSLIILS